MRAHTLLAIVIGSATALWANPLSAQIGPVPHREAGPSSAARSRSAPDARTFTAPRHGNPPSGRWGGPGCAKESDLIAMVDEYLSTASPEFPELGSPIAGASMAWRSRECGSFTYVAGFRNVERGLPMTPAARMSTGSMTKVVMSALTLRLMEQGLFGRRGLDTPVDKLLPPKFIRALTVGNDAANPRCPGETYLLTRTTGSVDWTAFECPDFSRVTLRDLMFGNHGMYDFLNEDALPDGTDRYSRIAFSELYEHLGFPPLEPVNSKNGLDYLEAFGLKHNVSSVIGGTSFYDFEVSLGNTGYQLLGIILEQRTGKSLDQLIRQIITGPLGIEPMEIYVRPQPAQSWADGYDVFTDSPFVAESGVYPVADINGHTAVNVRELGAGRPANVNMAGGAGALIATPRGYAAFLEALTNGRLLGLVAQRELNESFIAIDEWGIPGLEITNGLGLVKEVSQGLPGSADYTLLGHGGTLPGARCVNAAVMRPEARRVQFTGVLCVNSRRLVAQDLQSFWYQLLNVIADPATYGSP